MKKRTRVSLIPTSTARCSPTPGTSQRCEGRLSSPSGDSFFTPAFPACGSSRWLCRISLVVDNSKRAGIHLPPACCQDMVNLFSIHASPFASSLFLAGGDTLEGTHPGRYRSSPVCRVSTLGFLHSVGHRGFSGDPPRCVYEYVLFYSRHTVKPESSHIPQKAGKMDRERAKNLPCCGLSFPMCAEKIVQRCGLISSGKRVRR